MQTIPQANAGIITMRSPFPFAETVRHLQEMLTSHTIKLFATIDQQAEAAAVGLAMPPTTLILFGNPRAGTPLMVASPLAGLDLPLKALVSEAIPGEVTVSFNTAAYIIERHGLAADLIHNLAPAEKLIIQTLATSE